MFTNSKMNYANNLNKSNSDYHYHDDWDAVLLKALWDVDKVIQLEIDKKDAHDISFQEKMIENIPQLYRPAKTNKNIDDIDMFYHKYLYDFRDKIGDGVMDYITNERDKTMLTNAWIAISTSNNWDFISKDIDSFMWSNDVRIDEITKKMDEYGYSGHSGSSFGWTMRKMQYLVQNGEEEFKKLFITKTTNSWHEY
jgi:hypothetical protein